MKEKVSKKFQEIYGSGAILFASPGRINLIGEHTDYNGGFVFPGAVDKGIVAAIKLNGTDKVRAYALDLGESAEFGLNEADKPAQSWACYIFGVCREIQKRGGKIGGFDTVFAGDVPLGAGMSSSAALESTYAFALNDLYNCGIDKFELAKIGQSTEHNYCGVNCGIMDQFASSLGKKDNAILLNCKTLEYEYIPLELGNYSLVIANCNKPRSLQDSKYNERRAETEEALEKLKTVIPSAACLADISPAQFNEFGKKVLSGKVYDRAKHVIEECARVLSSAEALKKGEIEKFGEYLNQSHYSLRDLYEVTGDYLDALSARSREFDGCIGSRMTGAGFGGCTVSLVEKDKVDEFIKYVDEKYYADMGVRAAFYKTSIENGAQEIKE